MLNLVIYFLLACIVQLSVSTGFKLITNHDKKVHYLSYLLIIPFALIMTLEYHFELMTLNTLTSLFFYFVLYYLLYRKDVFDIIFYGATISIIGMIIDILVMIFSTIIPFKFFSFGITEIRFIDTILVETVLLFTLNSNHIKKWSAKLHKNMKKIKFPYLSFLLIMIVLISLGFTIYDFIQKFGLNSLSLEIYLLFFSITIFLIMFLNREYNNYELKVTNENIIRNNEFYLTIINDYRMLKHNLIHQLNGVKSVSNEKGQELINDLIQEYNQNTKTIQNMQKMPMGISGIVYEKIYGFENNELSIGIDNNINSNVYDELTPKSYNLLCEALGILLDNALEATEKTKEKILMIDMKETEESYHIKIINTFQTVLDIDALGTLKYTTKKTGHGIGLFSLIGRKKLKIKTSIINDLFFNEIIIEKK